MSVSTKKRTQDGLSQLVRTFFQRYDDGEVGERVATMRNLPGGALVTFFSEQFLQRGQRTFFGITLVEVKRLFEYAHSEAAELRKSLDQLEAEIAEVRNELRRS